MLAKNKLKQEIVKELQAELGGSIQEIESVVESQFDFVKRTMEQGLFNSIRLPYFGRFKVNPYRLRKLNIAIATKNTKK